jgi:hypothetical protein
MTIFSLVYVSSASGLFDKDVYRQIAIDARTFNESKSITGMLLVYNETIIQFLEGPEFEVSELYRRIEKDVRHKNPILISTRETDQREFLHWSMGYKESISISDPKYLFNLDAQTIGLHFPQNISEISKALLATFKRSSGLTAT